MTPEIAAGVLDTSIFIAREAGRPLDAGGIPDQVAVSTITIGELRWGIIAASDDEARSQRLDTLTDAQELDPIPVDDRVAAAWALLKQQLRSAGRKMEVNDSWIAATAIAHGWPVVTQDNGFPDDVPPLIVIRL